jgi:hypothetical protein
LCTVAIAATGCVPLGAGNRDDVEPSRVPGGEAWTFADASDVVREIPGVENVFMSVGPIGLPGTQEMAVGVDVQYGYPEELIPPLVDHILALAWSVPDEKPGFLVAFNMLRGGSSVDLEPTAKALGWTFGGGPGLELSSSDLEARYGQWPGQRPGLPVALADAVLPERAESPEPSPSPTP